MPLWSLPRVTARGIIHIKSQHAKVNPTEIGGLSASIGRSDRKIAIEIVL